MNEFPPTLVPDGNYIEQAYIRENPQGHCALRFEFRPLLTEELSEFLKQNRKFDDPATQDRFLAKELAVRITSWNIREADKDGKETPAKITARNILRIRSRSLLTRLAEIAIYGTDVSDVDPEWDVSEKAQRDNLQLESALSDTTPGQSRQETNEKN